MLSMNNTLLRALFLDPKPIPALKDNYELIFHRIFPNKKEFIDYLKLHDANERFQAAKRILEHICLDANYPPPTGMLSGLVERETSNVNRSGSQDYIPNDHYEHMVNLYLLGIYFYFYHHQINRVLSRCFLDTRNKRTPNPLLRSTKDFISSWKYFCLYHDTTYPIEFTYKTDSINHQNIKPKPEDIKALGLYNQYFIALKLDWSVEVLSKLVVFLDVLNDRANQCVHKILARSKVTYRNEEHKPFTHLQEEKFEETFVLDKIYQLRDFQYLSGFIEKKNIVYLVVDAKSDIPLGVKLFIDDHYCVYYADDYEYTYSRMVVTKLLDSLENKSNTQKAYVIKFAICDIDQAKNIVMHALDEMDETYSAITLLREQYDPLAQFNRISNEVEFNQYIFQTYKSLYSYLKDENGLGKLEWIGNDISQFQARFWTLNRLAINGIEIREFIHNEFIHEANKEIVKNAISDEMINQAVKRKLLNNPTEEGFKEAIGKILTHYLEYIKSPSNFNSLIKTMVGDMFNNLHNKMKQKNAIVKTLLMISKYFDMDNLDDETLCVVQDREFDYSTLLLMLGDDAIYKSVDVRMKKSFGITLQQLYSEYKGFTRYDHGLLSALYYLLSFRYFQGVINKLKGANKDENAILPCAWGEALCDVDDKLVNKYEFIVGETFYAILCHNIYKKHFSDSFHNTKWEFVFENDPFVYFCMMMDGLQKWGRRQYYNPIRIEPRPSIAMDDYNITFVDGQAVVTITSYEQNIEKVKRDTIDKLDEYLVNCSSFLDVILSRRR